MLKIAIPKKKKVKQFISSLYSPVNVRYILGWVIVGEIFKEFSVSIVYARILSILKGFRKDRKLGAVASYLS